jgi:ribosomal-protein-alanine N-acetyltransferase
LFNNFVRGAAQFCYLSYSLAEIEQGKGYMAEALQAAIIINPALMSLQVDR